MLNFYMHFKYPILDNYTRYNQLLLEFEELEHTAVEIGDDFSMSEFKFSTIKHIIKKSAYPAAIYSQYILKGRWLEVEPIIKKHQYYWAMYCYEHNIDIHD